MYTYTGCTAVHVRALHRKIPGVRKIFSLSLRQKKRLLHMLVRTFTYRCPDVLSIHEAKKRSRALSFKNSCATALGVLLEIPAACHAYAGIKNSRAVVDAATLYPLFNALRRFFLSRPSSIRRTDNGLITREVSFSFFFLFESHCRLIVQHR